MLKLGYETGVDDAGLRHLSELSRGLDERLYRTPDRHAAYVGASAFTHKAGLHASAVVKDPSELRAHRRPSWSAISATSWSPTRPVAPSLMTRLGEIGLASAPSEEQIRTLRRFMKEREASGYAYEGADASFQLLRAHARPSAGLLPPDEFLGSSICN